MAACRKTTDPVEGLAFKANADENWGLIATDGHILVASNTFGQQPSAIVNGMFCLPDGKGFYHLYKSDMQEHPVTPRRFARIGYFFEEVTLAQETPQSPICIIDKQGNTVASTAQYPQYDIVLAHNFREGRALIATREGKYGYMDTHGNIIVPPLYDCAYDFRDGTALVGITNRQGETGYQLITPEGKICLSIQLSNCLLSTGYNEGLLAFKNFNTGQCGYLDKKGTTIVCLPEEVKEAYTQVCGAAVFQTETGTGIIDARGNILLPAHYENASIMDKERIAVKHKGAWAIADKKGNLLSPFQYDSLSSYYSSGCAIACRQGGYSFIDRQGNSIDGNSYAFIAGDAVAHREVPQLFIREEREAKEGKQPTRQTPQNGKKQPGEAKRVTTIRSDEWKEIGKRNPFYEEANKVLSGKLEETDARRRQMILNYVEHLRTSYTTKDIDFLEQLFSENALIIVGTVIRTGAEAAQGYLSPSQVVYNVKSKREYLERLKQVFKANRKIEVAFSGFRITRHPTQPGIYGVSLRQGYTSDLYSDDGYLFLLWDFTDETAPKIHVRTWQPSLQEDHTPLPEDAILNIQNFNLQ